jgi:hypothetical protein
MDEYVILFARLAVRNSKRSPALLAALLCCGCDGDASAPAKPAAPRRNVGVVAPEFASRSDPEAVRAADVRILFIGNSHTHMHALPDLVGKLIAFRHPEKKVTTHALFVGYLDDAVSNPAYLGEIESRPWTHVVLQAQKISTSGKVRYAQDAGIELARRAIARGAAVYYFSEWGLKGRPDNGPHHESIYREMAAATGAHVIPVGRAWEQALAEDPALPLYEPDGNHESPTGTFLTACTIAAALMDEDPEPLAAFDHPAADEQVRKELARAASWR